MTDVETVISALLEHIRANVGDFFTVGRRVKHWSQVLEQPALFIRRVGMMDSFSGTLRMTTIECEAWIYCNAGEDPDAVPDDALIALEQGVRDCLEPTSTIDGRFTLNGLVYWCRIEGKSDIYPGDQAGQAIARIPISIKLP